MSRWKMSAYDQQRSDTMFARFSREDDFSFRVRFLYACFQFWFVVDNEKKAFHHHDFNAPRQAGNRDAHRMLCGEFFVSRNDPLVLLRQFTEYKSVHCNRLDGRDSTR